MLNEKEIYLFGQIQTSQKGGWLYSVTSPYGECSLIQTLLTKEFWVRQSSED